MKLLFVHDHPFYKTEDGVFSGGSFPSQIWDNYLINFDEIVVFGRNSKSKSTKNILSSNGENVSFNLTKYYSSIPSLIKNIIKLKKELSSLMEESDVVLVRLPSILGLIAGNIALRKKKKVWVEVVGNANEALNTYGSFLGKTIAPFLEKATKYTVFKADFVTYVTTSKLQKDYPFNKFAITESISNVILNNVVSSKDVNRERFFSEKMKIGLIGGFNARYKGQDILLKAIDELPKNIKQNIEIYFVGTGDGKWVKDLANNLKLNTNIKFLGSKQSGLPIFSFLEEMSLYIQPSFTEGMPRALLEAMSMGCPVMGSRVGGIPDAVSEDFLHNKGDYHCIAEQIKKIFYNRNILIQESIRSIEEVEPYLKINLDNRRSIFYNKINKNLSNG